MRKDGDETVIMSGHVAVTRNGVEYIGNYRVVVIGGKRPNKRISVSWEDLTVETHLGGEPGREEDSAEGLATVLLGELVTKHKQRG